MGLFSTIQSGLQSTLSSAGSSIATGIASKYLPAGVGSKLKTGISAVTSAAEGNLSGAAGSLLSAFGNRLPTAVSGLLGNALLQGAANPLFGGITPAKAKEIVTAIAARNYAKKNLFLVEIKNLTPIASNITGDDGPNSFNMFVTDLNYSPYTFTGNKHQIGSAEVDSFDAQHSVELRMNMLDDQEGNVQNFLDRKAAQQCGDDGTVGLPIEYLMEVTIIHGYTNSNQYNASKYFGKTYQMRLSGVEVDLDRRDDGLQSLQVTMTQFDTFSF